MFIIGVNLCNSVVKTYFDINPFIESFKALYRQHQDVFPKQLLFLFSIQVFASLHFKCNFKNDLSTSAFINFPTFNKRVSEKGTL